MVGGIDGKIHLKMAKMKTCYWFLKTYKEVKPHSTEESEDKADEGERDKYNNDEHVYYFLMGRAPARIQVWNGG